MERRAGLAELKKKNGAFLSCDSALKKGDLKMQNGTSAKGHYWEYYCMDTSR